MGPTSHLHHPSVSAQCPSCGLHELVAVWLKRGKGGNWKQIDEPSHEDTERKLVQIDACPVCYGAWFDAGELDILSGDLDGVESVLDDAGRPTERPCPHGHGAMLEHDLPGVISTPLDRCGECGGLWLDGHERRKLAKASTKEGQGTRTERWVKRGAIWAAQVLTHLPVEVENPARGTPYLVYILLATLLGLYIVQTQDLISAYDYGIVAGRMVRHWDVETLLTYMFLHGSWVHLLGNAYFLYTFGDNVEHLFGHVRFALFFVGAGLVGGLMHVWLTHKTALPVVGASGSIAGILAAYLWAFPRQRLFQVVLYIQLKIPVWVYLFVWVGFHIAMGFFASGAGVEQVAWFAHLGGFLFGLGVTPLLLRWRRRQVARAVEVPAFPT